MSELPFGRGLDHEHIDKANVVFETSRGLFTGLGMSVAAATIAEGIYSSWQAKTLHLPNATGVANLLMSTLTVAATVAGGAIGFANAVMTNRAKPAPKRARN